MNIYKYSYDQIYYNRLNSISYNYYGSLDNVDAMDFGLNWMVGSKVQLDLAANMNLRKPAHAGQSVAG